MGTLKRRIIEDMEPTEYDFARRWIPVEERLPEPWVSVLVAVHEYVCVGRVDTDGVWRDCRDETQGGVTHWMPLPEPPEVTK